MGMAGNDPKNTTSLGHSSAKHLTPQSSSDGLRRKGREQRKVEGRGYVLGGSKKSVCV
jgi:hypothetical protein